MTSQERGESRSAESVERERLGIGKGASGGSAGSKRACKFASYLFLLSLNERSTNSSLSRKKRLLASIV